ncbi:MAG TPA: DUF4956 domain-containing protein [Longimicrobium sp.]|nr:DUF4956 domain-containing protein [Longimicrobium sp.]
MNRLLLLPPTAAAGIALHPNGPAPAGTAPTNGAAPAQPRRWRLPRPVRRAPMLPLALYYGALAAAWAALGMLDPAIVGRGPEAARFPSEMAVLVAMIGALALMGPVVWVYMLTRRLRYDPSLVHSLIILPVVTAGIFLVIENSLARAFSLAGIMAAVRFRNTLRETRDIVYILLALGIGLAAGARALDVAVMMSGAFNVLVLVLWSFNVGSIYAAGSARSGILSVGETRLLLGTTPATRAEVRRGALGEVDGLRPDGVLLVHTPSAEAARSIVEEVLFEGTREWRRAGRVPNRHGVESLAYLVRLRKKQARPAELLGNLDECSMHVRAAEYLPLSRDVDGKHGRRGNHRGRGGPGDGDDEG